jgi:hypothetical protein
MCCVRRSAVFGVRCILADLKHGYPRRWVRRFGTTWTAPGIVVELQPELGPRGLARYKEEGLVSTPIEFWSTQ